MKQIHIDRLLKLAEHLERGQLAHQVFDFGHYNSTEGRDTAAKGECGFAGCALGECPAVFPDAWRFSTATGLPMLTEMKEDDFCNSEWWTSEAQASAALFFGLFSSQVEHLFLPNEQRPKLYGGDHLDTGSTRVEVASNIRAFVFRQQVEK